MSGLPPHRGLIINLCFFAVPGPDSPAPYGGNPPAEAATDCDKLLERVDLDTESNEQSLEHRFHAERSAGYYYVQVRVVLLRMGEGKVIAQAEQFFYNRRPVHIGAEPQESVTFPVSWPSEPLEALHHYGTISPQNKRPWWRFW